MGLAAASLASVQLTQADGVDSRVWSASASLRGFYDDNFTTSTGNAKQGSYGLEFSPSVSASVPLRQTDIGIRYTYGLYYYEQRDHLGENAVDQTHQVDLWVDHAFSETWHGKVQDTFVVGQEPQLLSNSGTLARVNGNNIANNGSLDLKTDWTQELGTEIGYQNHFYDYDQSGFTPAGASLAGLLNRDENDANINLNWYLTPHTVVYVGYQIGLVDYTGNEVIGTAFTAADPFGVDVYSKSRNNISHYGYVGVGTDLLSNLRFEGKAGVQYVDYYNSDYGGLSTTTEVSPYVDISATYTYLPGSYVQLGFTQNRNSIDFANFSSDGRVTQDAESSTLYATINHQITSKLLASLIGQWQRSSFNGGLSDSQDSTYYSLGLNLSYSITKHFGVDAGYNYDKLDSNAVGYYHYDRNRVYIGVNASY